MGNLGQGILSKSLLSRNKFLAVLPLLAFEAFTLPKSELLSLTKLSNSFRLNLFPLLDFSY